MKKLYELRFNENIVTDLFIEKTWLELKTLRDSGNLVPGQQYRITDYVATTNGDMNSRSANHPFDIIVTADDERTLNEHARAIMHETVLGFSPDTQCEVGCFYKYNGNVYKCVTVHTGEWNANDFAAESPYFYGCDLAVWDVWYCLDNDTSRFTWALGEGETDSQTGTTGRGVLYRLIDEFQNDVPYDFKGIQFCRWAITDITSAKLDNISLNSLKSSFVKTNNGGLYYAYQSYSITINDTTFAVDSSNSVWYFTFGGTKDLSLTGFTNNIYANKIAEYVYTHKRKLNDIVFLGSDCYQNKFDTSCYSNTFGSECSSNTFGSEFYYSILGKRCNLNTFDANCNSTIFGSSCRSNKFGLDCYSNIFNSSCCANTFGPGCSSNTFSLNCISNIFNSSCSSNTFYSNCISNTFSSECVSNTFNSSCRSNTFGSECYANIFGLNCSFNTFGSNCEYNTFGSGCYVGTWMYDLQKYAGTVVNYENTLRTVMKQFRASFSTSETYLVGETLYYLKKYWECTTEHSGAWDATHFTEIKLVGGILSPKEFVPLSYYRYIELEDGVSYVALDCTADRGNGVYYQNVTVSKGNAYTESAPKHIEDANSNQSFKTTYQPANSQVINI